MQVLAALGAEGAEAGGRQAPGRRAGSPDAPRLDLLCAAPCPQSKAMLSVKAHDADVNVVSWNRSTTYMLVGGPPWWWQCRGRAAMGKRPGVVLLCSSLL